jgi:D-glycero-D-manno-heptose 1,7-bisphosphate phosphatase
VIDDLRFCPHHPNAADQALKHCDCRKPSPKMILDLAAKHHIDLAASIMIGDRDTDVEAGEAAGCRGVLFTGGRLDLALKPHIL